MSMPGLRSGRNEYSTSFLNGATSAFGAAGKIAHRNMSNITTISVTRPE
jgi:hypothetical protein